MSSHDRPHIEVCNPTGAPDAPPKQLAPRLASLRGARIALLDNGKEFSDDVINAIGTVLKHELGVKEVRVWDKQFPAKAAPFLPELARSCDAVITGVGHWGSSAPWSARDAAALEELGVPTATVCSIAFAPLARVVARGLGHLSLPIAIIPHPVGNQDPAVVTRRGIDVAAECIRVLTTPAEELDAEFRNARYPLPPASVAK